jgi:hypothetical protein
MSADGCRMEVLEKNLLEKGIEDVSNLPPMEIARTFAVKTIDYSHLLACSTPSFFPQLGS